MTTALAFLRANPAMLALLAALAIVTVVFGALAILMTRAGVSLKPLAFMAGFLGLVAGPQIAFHAGQAYGIIPKRELAWTPDNPGTRLVENDAMLGVVDGSFANPEAVFGPDVDHDLIVDLRGRGAPFAGADVAQMAVIPPTGSAIVARYDDAAAAQEAAQQYVATSNGAPLSPGADGARTFTRAQGDVARVLVVGRTLLVLTGPDQASISARLNASGIVSADTSSATSLSATAAPREEYWLYRPPLLIGLVLLLVMLTTLYFFKASAWAASVPAREGVSPRSVGELRQRLLAVNELDVPFTMTERPDGKLAVTWRFADARWLDLAGVHGMRRTHRILLELDPDNQTVYPTEQFSRFDASAGLSGGGVRWSGGTGIVFFELEEQRVFGLQFDERGRFVPKASYTYRFNLQEMKAPLIKAVTESGWQWRPTVWQGPRWLRWLTH